MSSATNEIRDYSQNRPIDEGQQFVPAEAGQPKRAGEKKLANLRERRQERSFSNSEPGAGGKSGPEPSKADVQAAVDKARKDGYLEVGPGDKLPEPGMTLPVSDPEKYGKGTLVYLTYLPENPHPVRFVVSQVANPEEYKRLADFYSKRAPIQDSGPAEPTPKAEEPDQKKDEVQTAIEKAKKDGYAELASGEGLPDYDKLLPGGDPEKYGKGTLVYSFRVEENPHPLHRVISEKANPKEYKQLAHFFSVKQSIEQCEKEGCELRKDDTGVPEPGQIKTAGSPNEFKNGVIRYQTNDGKWYVVSKDQSPNTYQRIASLAEVKDIKQVGDALDKAKQDGFESISDASFKPDIKKISVIHSPNATDGTIRFEMEGGKKYVAQKDLNPIAYAKMEKAWGSFKAIEKAREGGYKRLGNDAKAPEFKDIATISSPDEFGQGVMRYTTADGKKYYVYSEYNPEAYDRLVQMQGVKTHLKAAQADGYQSLDQGKKPPLFNEYMTIEPADQQQPGVIKYETTDGKKWVVTKETNPDAYTRVKNAGAAFNSPEDMAAIRQGWKDGYTLMDVGYSGHTLKQISSYATDKGPVLQYTTDSGDKVMVSKLANPELYAKVKNQLETLDLIKKAEEDGYKKVDENGTVGDNAKIDKVDSEHGFIQFKDESGNKLYVVKEWNAGLHNKLAGRHGRAVESQLDKDRKNLGLPTSSDIDVMEMESDVKRETAKGEEAKPDQKAHYTIGELVTKNVLDDYRKKIEKGEIPRDDPRAKFLRALEARTAVENGWKFARPGPRDIIDLSKEDMSQLISRGKVDNELIKLLQDPGVKKDFADATKAALDHLPDKDKAAKKIESTLRDSKYLQMLSDLRKDGKAKEAAAMLQRDLASLALVAPDKVTGVAQDLYISSLEKELEELEADPSKIDPEVSRTALKDTAEYLIASDRSGSGLIRHSVGTIDFLNEFVNNKQMVSDVDSLRRALAAGDADQRRLASGELDPESDLGKQAMARAMQNSAIPMANRSGVAGFIAQAQKFGVWGTLSGGGALAAFGYHLSKGAWGKDSTAAERWTAARDLLAALSVTGHISKTGAKIVDTIAEKWCGGEAGANAARKALGLDLKLPEMWGKQAFVTWPGYTQPSMAEVPESMLATVGDRLVSQGITADASTVRRIGQSFLKVIGTVTDFLSVGDIVLGAIGLADKNADTASKVFSGLNLASGVFGTVAAGVGTAELIFGSTMPAWLSGLAAPAFMASAVIGGAALIGGVVYAWVMDRKLQQKWDDMALEQDQWLTDLENDGVMQDGWDKLFYPMTVAAGHQQHPTPRPTTPRPDNQPM